MSLLPFVKVLDGVVTAAVLLGAILSDSEGERVACFFALLLCAANIALLFGWLK